jgi:formate dehydrogenase alpha subunit
MDIRTDSPRALEARRRTLELILTNHPETCVICEKGNACQLRDLASGMGLALSSEKRVGTLRGIVDANPFIHRDLSKCIGCQICVRACREIQGAEAVEFTGISTGSSPLTANDSELAGSACELCGLCVAMCPVGALIEKPSKHTGTEDRRATVICPYCGVGCTLELRIREDRIVGVGADVSGSVNGPSLCAKGRYGLGYVGHPDRLTAPLVREGDELVETSWEDALKRFTEGLRRITEKHGADAVGVLASAKATNEENYLIQKFTRACIGTNNVDHCARLCHSPTVAGLSAAFGSGAMTNSLEDLAEADVILLTGTNTIENHPVIAQMIKTAVLSGGTRLIVSDPRDISMARYAEVTLSPRLGTDVAWLNGMANVVLSEGLADERFIKERTEDFDEWRASVEPYTPELVRKITGIKPADLKWAARLYASASAAAIYYAMGITQHSTGTDNVKAVANLAMLTGNIGRPGTGVNPLRGQNNVQGACDVGALPNVFPGYQQVTDKKVRKEFEKAWGVKLPAAPGLTVTEMIEAAAKGKLKAMYIIGENPVMTEPDASHAEAALCKLDFLVIQDIFLTESAAIADIVLPSMASVEKEGTFTNTERLVQRSRAAVPAPSQARSDADIVCDIAGLMKYPMNYSGPSAVMEEISSLTPSYGGISYSRLGRRGLRWPCPDSKHRGTKILHLKEFTRGKGKFHPVEYIQPAEMPDEEYPFILTTGRMPYQFHAGSMSRRSAALDEYTPEGWAELNPSDAKSLGIKEGDPIELSSRRGTVRTTARLSRRSPRGAVFMSFHFAEQAANKLTNPVLDKEGKIPEFKVCAVRVEPAVPE